MDPNKSEFFKNKFELKKWVLQFVFMVHGVSSPFDY
jgi:hypothetical protein